MSYDLAFVPKAVDQSWEQAFEGARDSASGELPGGETWAGIVTAAQRMLGEVTASREAGFYELSHEPTGIQLSLESGSARITVPYWYTGADAEMIVRKVFEFGLVVERHTGLTGYDVQTELSVTDAAARPELAVAMFEQVASSFARRGVRSPGNA